MGYGDARAKESRVRTRITDTGPRANNNAELILYGVPSWGRDGDRGQVSILNVDTGIDAQDTGGDS